jgi:hypothetical protein
VGLSPQIRLLGDLSIERWASRACMPESLTYFSPAHTLLAGKL